MTNAALLASRYARRPLLLTPEAAFELANRVRVLDERAFSRPGRLDAFLRKVGLSGQRSADVARPMAMDDDGWTPPPPIEERLAYAPLWAGEPEDLGFCWSLVQGVALMQCDTPLVERGEEFCGVVYHGYDTLLAAMRDASGDDRVKGMFLRLSSPGGVVAGGLPALAAFMRQARAQAGGKPIHVYADMAASAAYWIAAQADRITAPNVGIVGSIGAVLVHENYEGALGKAGVEITSIEFPFDGSKTDGAWWKALSGPARADLQAEIDQCGRNFVADVAAGRPKLTPDALLATKARVFMGEHDEAARSGLALGFVDAIRSEENAFDDLLTAISGPSVPVSGAPAASPAPAAASGSLSGGKPSKETPMATGRTQSGGRVAAAPASRPASAVRPAAAAAAPETNDMEEEGEAEDAADGGADEAAEGEGGADEAAEGEGGEDTANKKPAEAEKIAASAEAQAQPRLAFAAIRSGQTLEQFQASVAALAPAPKTSKLDAAMSGAQRLGADAPQASSGPKAINPQAIYASRREAQRGR